MDVRRQLSTVALIAPFAVWMVMLAALPATAAMYALRTAVTALLLAWSLWCWRDALPKVRPADFGWGLVVGVAVGVIWVAPESFEFYRRYGIIGEGGTADIAMESAIIKGVRLVGSAFVIAVAEELFFRRWLQRWAGLGWTVVLFAVEHDRYLVGAVAALAYGILARRRGLFAAIVAHSVTNLALGLYVLKTGEWQFW